jgi:hypothetical protein
MVKCTRCDSQWSDGREFCGKCGGRTAHVLNSLRMKLWLILLAGICIAYVILVRFYDWPEVGTYGSMPLSIPFSDTTVRTPAPYVLYTPIEATDLALAYEANEIRADLNYKGTHYRVSGKITGIGKEILGRPYLMLDNKVQAVFDSKEEAALSRYDKGMSVTGNCIVSGKLGWVLLKDCRL